MRTRKAADNTMSEGMTPQEVSALKKDFINSFFCAMPGFVTSFDKNTQLAYVRPAVSKNGRPLPSIGPVPVFFPGTRDVAITWPVSPGDECLILYLDYEMDGWLYSGNTASAASDRRHSLSDAFAIVGFRSVPNALQEFPDEPTNFPHDHNDLYYTKEEVDYKLAHHSHDSRYYTKQEIDEMLGR